MKFRNRLLCALFVLLLTASLAVSAEAADESMLTNRFNVVFVNDESASMSTNDSKKLRYDAMELFVGLMAEENNMLGSVSFNHELLNQNLLDISRIMDKADKDSFKETVFSAKQSGTTNIGLALKTAVEMLDSKRDESLPSIIILLTDGKTEMRSDEEMQLSLDQKADAIEACREAGYKIYTICLGGGEHQKELAQIASATGGEYALVEKPEDLGEVQKMFYGIIFKAVSEDPIEETLDENGYASESFNVPVIGVEELNIIIEGEVEKFGLTSPKGHAYSPEELEGCTQMRKGSLIMLKIKDPQGGLWTVDMYGKPGIEVRFQPLYNSSYTVVPSISKESGYAIGDVVTFNTKIMDKGKLVENPSDYIDFEGKIYITEKGVEKPYDMTLGKDGFEYSYKITEEGTVYVRFTIGKNGTEKEAEKPYVLKINNQDPVAPEEPLKAHANIWPIFGGKAVLDLNGAVTDPDEGDIITYSVDSTAFNDEDYVLEDNVLTVKHFSVSKGSFTIRASDNKGASCTFDVLMTSTNIGLIMLIAIVAGGLIVLGSIVAVIYHNYGVPFMGTVTVEKRDPNDYSYLTPTALTPSRGRVYLESFGFGTVGLPPKSYFQAGGRQKCIYFVSKKPVYSSVSFKPSKKVKISGNGAPVILSSAESKTVGVSVSFRSILVTRY